MRFGSRKEGKPGICMHVRVIMLVAVTDHLPMELTHSIHFPVSDANPSAKNTSSSLNFQPTSGYKPATDTRRVLKAN